MKSSARHPNRHLISIFRPATGALATAIAFALVVIAPQTTQAQTFAILHNFTGGEDGAQPYSALTMDAAGNLYGTTSIGGHTASNCYNSCGTVFRMKRVGQSWVLNPLYEFSGGTDGANPSAKVVFGADGSLYGETPNGGLSCPSNTQYGCGTVFNLRPQARACTSAVCPWTETVLYRFYGGSDDGAVPLGNPVLDRAGNLYGTTFDGGYVNDNNCIFGQGDSCGTVFELVPSNGGWTESLLYRFLGDNDGSNPEDGLIFDQSGNLYGTSFSSGAHYGGTVFELAPSGSGWTESTLYSFSFEGSSGYWPRFGVIFDPAGNLYGTTLNGGYDGGGTVFQLQPSSGGWNLVPLYSFPGNNQTLGPDGDLAMDNAGNLYGTTGSVGSHGLGLVFKLSPSINGWTYTVLHEFTGGQYDGALPVGGVTLDAEGNLYGTASDGGTYNLGVVWEITP
jgi:uncharacterized repeat protein (TIGR03803 family)